MVRPCPGGPQLSALGFCITLFAFSVFWQLKLAQVMERVIPQNTTPIVIFYLLQSFVQILWMMTDFWSLIVTPVDTDQFSNAPLFDKSHYCSSNQENQNLKNLKTVSIYQNVSKNTALTNLYSLSSENQFHVLLSPHSLVLQSLLYLTLHCHS